MTLFCMTTKYISHQLADEMQTKRRTAHDRQYDIQQSSRKPKSEHFRSRMTDSWRMPLQTKPTYCPSLLTILFSYLKPHRSLFNSVRQLSRSKGHIGLINIPNLGNCGISSLFHSFFPCRAQIIAAVTTRLTAVDRDSPNPNGTDQLVDRVIAIVLHIPSESSSLLLQVSAFLCWLQRVHD